MKSPGVVSATALLTFALIWNPSYGVHSSPTFPRLVLEESGTGESANISGRVTLPQNMESWRKVTFTPMLKAYFFNVTNGQEFLDNPGTKLVVKEFGPYTYSEVWENVDPVWNPNGTISYRQKKIFQFERELSIGSEEDIYVIPNIMMLKEASSLKNANRVTRKAVNAIFDILHIQPFEEKSVRQMMWGYDDTLLKLGKTLTPEGKRPPFDQLGFLYGKNNTQSDVLTVLTGQDKPTDYAQVNVSNGKEALSFWGTGECNKIKGTDGTSFPAGLDENSTLHIFNPSLCRSISLEFHKEINYQSLSSLRFQPSEANFGDVETYPQNKCFCPDGSCARRGTFNMSACYYDIPLFLSWPHFLHGDPTLSSRIDGLIPNPDLHQFYIDVQPKFGIPTEVKARIQINIQMPTAVPEISLTSKFSEILIPVVWFEEGIVDFPDVARMELLQQDRPDVVEASVPYTRILCSISGIILLCGIVYLFKRMFMNRQESVED